MRPLMVGVTALVVAVLTVSTLAGCVTPTPPVPGLDAVRAERSLTITSVWLRAAAATDDYIEQTWPEATYPPLRFERWVEPEKAEQEVLNCMTEVLDRVPGFLAFSGIITVFPRPPGEPTWALPVAQLRCSVQRVPWTGQYPFGGSVEHEWVRHQLTVALPQCVRRFGAELVIPDLAAAIDASIYPTTAAPSTAEQSTAERSAAQQLADEQPVSATQSVWLAAELRRVDAATAQLIRATCPDPGRTLAQLGPADIRSIEVGPSGGTRGSDSTGADDTGPEVSP